MSATILFYIIIGILILNFIWDKYLDYLNAKRFGNPIPEPLQGVYDQARYIKSQEYQREKYRFSWITGTLSITIMLVFFFFEGFAWIDSWARSISNNEIVVGLLFFGVLMGASSILSLPFSYYSTFVIEEKYGFNKTNLSTFIFDKLKGAIMAMLLGGGLYALIVWFYEIAGSNFWLYDWAVITLFSIFLIMFYARLIVPIFNKQTPLENGELRDQIEKYATQVGFDLKNICH